MEIVKAEPAEFRFKELTLLVLTKATLAHAAALQVVDGEGARLLSSGLMVPTVKAIMDQRVAEIFIEGWSGVLIHGKPAPYSFAALMSLGAVEAGELLPELAKFIAANVDVLKQRTEKQRGR